VEDLESVSAYYYTGAVTVFQSMWLALRFLFTYRATRTSTTGMTGAAVYRATRAGVALFSDGVPEGSWRLSGGAMAWRRPLHPAVVLLIMF